MSGSVSGPGCISPGRLGQGTKWPLRTPLRRFSRREILAVIIGAVGMSRECNRQNEGELEERNEVMSEYSLFHWLLATSLP